MSRCLLAKFFGCKGERILDYIPHLVRAVNKLRGATGYTGEISEYRQDIDDAQEAMQDAVQTIKTIAKNLDAQRLERVADADIAREAEDEMKVLRQRAAQLEQENKKMQRLLAEKPAPAKPDETQSSYKGLAVSLIRFRDQLLYFKDEFDKDGNAQTSKLLGNLYKETGRFMSENGVEPMDESGVFDPQRQMVNDTQKTDDPELDNTIASTFRPGYIIKGEIYRPQEVILYVLNKGE